MFISESAHHNFCVAQKVVITMPSRKKAQGKARKAAKAKAEKVKEAASLPPKNFSEITLDSWLTCCEGEDNGDGNDNESERCHHGCDLSMPK